MKKSRDVSTPWSLGFRRERETLWRRLDRIVEKGNRKGAKSLAPGEAAELPSLYRVALSSLSVARAAAMDRALVDYLESLASRAWLLVYCTRTRERGVVSEFFFRRFPAALGGLKWGFPLALFFFLLGTVLAWWLTSASPEWFYSFVDPSLAGGRDPWASRAVLEKTLYSGKGWAGALSTFAGFLFTHNAQVGILAFSVGVAAGLPAAYLLFTNGLMLGAFLSVFSGRGLLFPFLGWLLPHGIPEILALLLCGAAGMEVGRALLFPGNLARLEALKRAGRKGAVVLTGAFFLFAWAGVMEGVFRQVVLSDLARLIAAALDLVVLGGWFLLAGREGGGA